MSGYDLLKGVRVLEVAALGPSSLGGYLADMGADVVKVEDAAGDGVRYAGNPAMGSPNGQSLLHLRWNRGKKSIQLDLKADRDRATFLQLVAKADVVINTGCPKTETYRAVRRLIACLTAKRVR